MEIVRLRTAGESTLKQHFTKEETQALRFYADGKNRTSTMFDFAARCYDGEVPTIRHPLGYGDARCTLSMSFKNIYNTLHFAAPGGDDFVVVQRVTFMDALIFPGRGVAIIIRSIKADDLADVIGSLEKSRPTEDPAPREFGGFVVSHQRPYHYFYESLPAMLWFARHVRPSASSSRTVDVVQLPGGDYMPLSMLFPGAAAYTATSRFLNWSNAIANTFFVKLGYSGMWDNDPAQKKAIDLLDEEIRATILSDEPAPENTSARAPALLFDISDAKGTWETLSEDIPVIINQLMDRLGSEVTVYLDGWTLPPNPTSRELSQAQGEADLASAIGKTLPEGARFHSLVGASPYVKMKHMRNVDAAVCRYSTGSLVPSRVMHKPGIVHHSGKASIFKKLHFHGPGMHELVGKPADAATAARDQDISYSLDSKKIVRILGDILQL